MVEEFTMHPLVNYVRTYRFPYLLPQNKHLTKLIYNAHGFLSHTNVSSTLVHSML